MGRPLTLRVLAYNIRHCQGADGIVSIPRTARVISAIAPDVCGLFEVLSGPDMQDQPAALSRLTGMSARFHAVHERRSGGWLGNLVLARDTIGEATEIPLGGRREARGCMIVDVELGGARLAVAATHLSLSGATRRRQMEILAATLPRDRPLVLLGDLNSTKREQGPLEELLAFSSRSLPTFPSVLPILPLDHIGFSGDWALERIWTERTLASDHLPLVAELRLNGGELVDDATQHDAESTPPAVG